MLDLYEIYFFKDKEVKPLDSFSELASKSGSDIPKIFSSDSDLWLRSTTEIIVFLLKK